MATSEEIRADIVRRKRFDRAWKLERVFRTRGWGVDTVKGLSDNEWKQAAQIAELKSPPSAITRALCVHLMTKNPQSQ